ncbi:MAG TPA: hypothetical protein VJ720_13405, partial [Chitinophaga sp.]|nr:hypothetical protein [Chitinophaga sp.]
MIPSIQKITQSPILSILAIVAVVILLWRFSCQRSATIVKTIPDSIPSVQNRFDQNGKLVAVIRAQEVKLLANEHIIDSLAAALKVKPTLVKSVDRYIQRIDTVIRTEVIYQRYQDSIVITKKDGYIDLKAVGRDSGVSSISLKHIDTLWRTEVRKSPLLKSPYTEVYLRSSSPYNHISHGSLLQIKSPRPLISVGPYIGYDPIHQNISTGL